MQTTEINHFRIGRTNLCSEGIEVLFSTSQSLVKHFLYTFFVELHLRCVGQALTVRVLVMNDHDSLGFKDIDDVVARDNALLVIAPAVAEHSRQPTFSDLGVGCRRTNADDPGVGINLVRRDDRRRTEMPDHCDHFVCLNQPVRYSYSLFWVTSIVPLNETNLFAIDTAIIIYGFSGCLRPSPDLIPVSRIGARKGPGHTDHYIGMNNTTD
ncbi:hypothetical protein D3C84_522930 [compost metagenome]